MLAPTSTDILDEDAADLQFPKDMEVNIEDWFVPAPKPKFTIILCTTCKKEIKLVTYVICVECNINICCQCFMQGLETVQHESTHRYRIETKLCPIFKTSDWTKEEELSLLNALLEKGHGNWSEISKIIKRKPDEIEKHYNKYYIHNFEKLEDFPKLRGRCPEPERVIHKYSANTILEEPPRFPIGTSQYKYYAGYNAARGDFETEYENNAEKILSCVLFSSDDESEDEMNDDKELHTEIRLALVDSYNQILKERERRKQVVKEHCLLTFRKFNFSLIRYEQAVGKEFTKRIQPFLQLLTMEQLTYLLEGLDNEFKMKQNYLELKMFRKNGLTTHRSGKLFKRLSASRDDALNELRNSKLNPNLYMKAGELKIQPGRFVTQRKTPPPLNILLLPGYEKLTQEERQLCSVVRIIPETFVSIKDALISENRKNGGVRLATARQMFKMDVNKTRKVYDLLVGKGLINKIA